MSEVQIELITKKRFEKMVAKQVTTLKCTHIEGALKVCDDLGIPPEDVSSYISADLKQKIASEAMALNLLKYKEEANEFIG